MGATCSCPDQGGGKGLKNAIQLQQALLSPCGLISGGCRDVKSPDLFPPESSMVLSWLRQEGLVSIKLMSSEGWLHTRCLQRALLNLTSGSLPHPRPPPQALLKATYAFKLAWENVS